MPSMTGTFKLISSENFEEFLKVIGVGLVQRKLLATATTTIDITTEEDEWTITTSTPLKTTEIRFKLGEEFVETAADGRSVKSVITQEGDNKLVHIQEYNDAAVTVTILRDFTDTEMKMTFTLGSIIIAYRTFQKQ